ncbi:hypothetical protein OOT00_03630 [Desulfobotulus sp. H1]|uniref:Uncharacterized protein n=1 Tax=Desulfobotulus pelophilus TaxID=2823377 RepID=A0ABT3N6L2_9BACT|nr:MULTISPECIES: hypothetical protein [Desulfobotulus]MCW7753074.1 hypothetical protein [Desulfobotulus pelophilus]
MEDWIFMDWKDVGSPFLPEVRLQSLAAGSANGNQGSLGQSSVQT